MRTRAAWVGSHEVVEVKFRPSVLPFERLLEAAIARSCDQRVFAQNDTQLAVARKRLGERASQVERYDTAKHGAVRPVNAGEELYYLNRSSERYLPLTPVQARQVNSALGAAVLGAKTAGTDARPDDFLSPRQSDLARRITAALERDRKALDKLARPDDLDALAAYTVRLERALTAASR